MQQLELFPDQPNPQPSAAHDDCDELLPTPDGVPHKAADLPFGRFWIGAQLERIGFLSRREQQILKDIFDKLRAPISPIMAAARMYGGQAEFAKAMGVTQQAVSQWASRGWVSIERAVEIEALTGIPRIALINPDVAKRLAGSDPQKLFRNLTEASPADEAEAA